MEFEFETDRKNNIHWKLLFAGKLKSVKGRGYESYKHFEKESKETSKEGAAEEETEEDKFVPLNASARMFALFFFQC